MGSRSTAKGKRKKKTSRVALPLMGREEALGAGEIVLAKIDLLPLLPGMIATVDELPDSLKRSRPPVSVNASSSKKEQIFYAVRFFPKGDYEWASLDRIARLTPTHVAAFLDNRLSEDTNERLYGVGKNRVIAGYRAAARPEEWLASLAPAGDKKKEKSRAKEQDTEQPKKRFRAKTLERGTDTDGENEKAEATDATSAQGDELEDDEPIKSAHNRKSRRKAGAARAKEKAVAPEGTVADTEEEDELKDDVPQKPASTRTSRRKAASAGEKVDTSQSVEGNAGNEQELKRGRRTAGSKEVEDPGPKSPLRSPRSSRSTGMSGEQSVDSKDPPARKIGVKSRAEKKRAAASDTGAPATHAKERPSRLPGSRPRAKRRARRKAEDEGTPAEPESEEDSGRVAPTISQVHEAAETDTPLGTRADSVANTDDETDAQQEHTHGTRAKQAGATNRHVQRPEEGTELSKGGPRPTKASRNGGNNIQSGSTPRKNARLPFFTFPESGPDNDPSPLGSEPPPASTPGKGASKKKQPSSRRIGPASRVAAGAAERDGDDTSKEEDSAFQDKPPAGENEGESDGDGGGSGCGPGEVGDKHGAEAQLKETLTLQKGVKRKRPASGDGEGRSKEPKRQKKDAGMYSITDARYEELDSSAEAATIVQWRYDIQVALFPHGNRKPSSSPKLMSQVADTFALLDSFEGMTIEYLAYSKLLPLMKRITTADPDRIPRDSFFRFRERAAAFVEKWEEMLDGMTLED